MKTAFNSSVIVLLLTSSLFSQNTTDEDAIKTLVNEHYRALLDKNLDKYVAGWAHRKTAARISVSQRGINEMVGWKDLSKYYKDRFEKGPDTSGLEFEYRNFSITVQDEMAWASFDKFMNVGDGMKKQTREFRVLIKEDGKWKNLSMIFVSS